ncbi:hypothetical protein GCM10007100_03890 [Roseibacillus persicicus]|uniref:Alpha-2-macroglobulin domain-containing protein n=1 Tax=Roseibacillus persicicus TaxID=454148 RepID=A0A918WF33_9BACT|nr:hypothetical protein GCM10007100_03890 [Roseibacillus persicicus]
MSRSLKSLVLLLSATSWTQAGENLPPTVSFPLESFERVSPHVLEVQASIDDDGLPADGNKDTAWQLISGSPEGVSISGGNSSKGSFEFHAPGSYILRFIASDGELESSRDFYVGVGDAGITDFRSFEVLDSSYRAARQAWAALREKAYPNGQVSPHAISFDEDDYELEEAREVIVTLLHDGASLRNSLAWFDASDTGESNGRLIWSDVATGPAAPLETGARTSLGLLPAGTKLRFYLIQDGAGHGTTILSQDSQANEGGKVMVAGRFSTGGDSTHYLAFEDRLQGDDSYDDVVLQIEYVEPAHEVLQIPRNLENEEVIASDRGSRGVQALLSREAMDGSDCEVLGGVFQMPAEDISYTFEFLDDRSSMKFTLGVVALDRIWDLCAPSLLFREQAITDAVTIMDDRSLNPGDSVTFEPANYGLLGKRVIFFIIPNNTKEVYLRNAWRYTPRGNGERTKRQPLFTIGEANPNGVDQFLLFSNETQTLMTIEDYCRAESSGEAGEPSDSSFDDIQIKITPALVETELNGAYYGSTIDYTLGYGSSDGLSPSILNYDLRAIMRNARGSSRWDLLFSTLLQPDGAFLTSEFGESLPISPSGALSVNIAWENGERPDYFIEQQRYGADLIETGVILEDAALIADGIKMINWGFDQQASDGSFPGTGDAVHSTSLFLEAAARAGLALRNYKPRAYRRTIRQWRRKVHLTAHWFASADSAGRDVNLEPFGHRYFLRAAALEQSSRFTRDRTLSTFAEEYISEAISLQDADGTFYERGEFDASYQMVGMAFASRYFSVGRNYSLRQDLSLTIWNGISRFLDEVSSEGEIHIGENSRTATETSRSGAAKRFDYKHATKALVFAEEGLLMPGAEEAAALILNYNEVLD